MAKKEDTIFNFHAQMPAEDNPLVEHSMQKAINDNEQTKKLVKDLLLPVVKSLLPGKDADEILEYQMDGYQQQDDEPRDIIHNIIADECNAQNICNCLMTINQRTLHTDPDLNNIAMIATPQDMLIASRAMTAILPPLHPKIIDFLVMGAAIRYAGADLMVYCAIEHYNDEQFALHSFSNLLTQLEANS